MPEILKNTKNTYKIPKHTKTNGLKQKQEDKDRPYETDSPDRLQKNYHLLKHFNLLCSDEPEEKINL